MSHKSGPMTKESAERSRWPWVLNRIRAIIERKGAGSEILASTYVEGIGWEARSHTLQLTLPDILRNYIELNMDEFKPVLWPFIQSHGCSRLIYKNL